ncbi:MAG: tetratricopeptide repeat protein [Candidatus Riflebacteria bacterium]|nr:tetratricopeptide repeat protein [Candidatus Riflebacteria bacterium]
MKTARFSTVIYGICMIMLLFAITTGYTQTNSKGSIDERFENGRMLGKKGQYSEAIKVFEGILAEEPNHAKTLLFLGISFVYSGNSSKALQIQERLGKIDAKAEANLKKVIQKGPPPKEGTDSNKTNKLACYAMGISITGAIELYSMDNPGVRLSPDDFIDTLKAADSLSKAYKGCPAKGTHRITLDKDKAILECSIHGKITELPAANFLSNAVIEENQTINAEDAEQETASLAEQPPKPRVTPPANGNRPARPGAAPPRPLSVRLNYVLERKDDLLAYVESNQEFKIVGVGEKINAGIQVETIDANSITVFDSNNPANKKVFDLLQNKFKRDITDMDPRLAKSMEDWHQRIIANSESFELKLERTLERNGEYFAVIPFHFRYLVVSVGETVDESIRILAISNDSIEIENLLTGKKEVYAIDNTTPR